MITECICGTSVETYDGPDIDCPVHGQCAAWGHPLDGGNGGTSCHCGTVTPLTPAPVKPPLQGPLTNFTLGTDGNVTVLAADGTWKDLGNAKVHLPPMETMKIKYHSSVASKFTHNHTEPVGFVTSEQMQQWLLGLMPSITTSLAMKFKDELPPGTYLDWQTAPLTSGVNQHQLGVELADPEPEENPATAPCRVFWNSHGCDKPRIHVLPGHPAGPEHQCGWNANPDSDVDPCSRVSPDGLSFWGYDTWAEQWQPIGDPAGEYHLHGEDWPG